MLTVRGRAMDPGTALNAVSLAFQVFSGCIKGCQLLLEAQGMPENFDYLRHRLKLEELKLLDWWLASRLVEAIESPDPQVREKRRAMIGSLEQIQSVTLDLKRIQGRYGLMFEVANPDMWPGGVQSSSESPTIQASIKLQLTRK